MKESFGNWFNEKSELFRITAFITFFGIISISFALCIVEFSSLLVFGGDFTFFYICFITFMLCILFIVL